MKTYTDSYLESWSKKELINYIRMLEYNCNVLENNNNIQFENIKKFVKEITDLKTEISRVLNCFNGYINSNNELIVISRTNRFVDLKRTISAVELQSKIIEYISRDCVKTEPFNNKSVNQKWQMDNLIRLNKYLGTNFTRKDMELIYDKLGNGINRKLTTRFIENNYDLEVLKEERLKDWTGNQNSIYTTLGASNHTYKERQIDDYYATEPKAMELLLKEENFNPIIWECACGEGYLSKILEKNGYKVISTDLIDRGFGISGIDFLKDKKEFEGDIITNPPYKYALEFCQTALETVKEGNKVAMFLKIQFLEGQKRKKFFLENPPKIVYVSSSRLMCAMNGNFEKYPSSAMAYAWFVWEKGYKGNPIIKWIN